MVLIEKGKAGTFGVNPATQISVFWWEDILDGKTGCRLEYPIVSLLPQTRPCKRKASVARLLVAIPGLVCYLSVVVASRLAVLSQGKLCDTWSPGLGIDCG
jgi:hypothetical protein